MLAATGFFGFPWRHFRGILRRVSHLHLGRNATLGWPAAFHPNSGRWAV